MHLLLGNLHDPLCLAVRDALEARDLPALVIANPMTYPARFEWRLDNKQSASRLVCEEGPPISNDHIAGVLVRHTGWLDPAGWEPGDLAYMQSETQAALLAWLWSLACPVVNRYPAAIWYRPQASALLWRPLLRRVGLPAMETLVTNVEYEARAFARRLADDGVPGAVYGPLTSDVRYLVSCEEDWSGLAALQRVAPVYLAEPHGDVQSVCVVGERVVWDGEPASDAVQWEPRLRSFAAAAGLEFVEVSLAPASAGMCVVAVEPHPRYDLFGGPAHKEIVEGIVHLLTSPVEVNRNRAVNAPQWGNS